MKFLKYYILFFFSITSLWAQTHEFHSDSIPEYKLLNQQTEYTAGNHIELQFSTIGIEKPDMYCSSSYGSTFITPFIENSVLHYIIPKEMSLKRGIINWKLVGISSDISGKFHILSTNQIKKLETYIGPPSIEAGGTDYTTAVVIPTDALDNPLEDSTRVQMKYQFLDSEMAQEVFSKNLIAYRDIYAPIKSGRMLLSSQGMGTNSKEFTVIITPAIATNFTITAERTHAYADGNQVTTFTTSVIKDKQNNVVSDGTFVNFVIKTDEGTLIKTSGMTISGVAIAKMIHPDHEENYTVKAYVVGMAESNTISLNYIQTIKEFKVKFSTNNRVITVGPFQSFMDQMIPDGLQVRLTVSKNNVELETYLKTTFNGFVQFKLKEDIFMNDNYDLRIDAAKLTESFKDVQLW